MILMVKLTLSNKETVISMPVQLPTVTINGQSYFYDERLSELRNTQNPHDVIPVECDGFGWQDASMAEGFPDCTPCSAQLKAACKAVTDLKIQKSLDEDPNNPKNVDAIML